MIGFVDMCIMAAAILNVWGFWHNAKWWARREITKAADAQSADGRWDATIQFEIRGGRYDGCYRFSIDAPDELVRFVADHGKQVDGINVMVERLNPKGGD